LSLFGGAHLKARQLSFAKNSRQNNLAQISGDPLHEFFFFEDREKSVLIRIHDDGKKLD
jgi:hypothetical protein